MFIANRILPCAPLYVTNAMCVELVPLEGAWRGWVVSVDSLRTLNTLAQDGDAGAKRICLRLLCAVDWERSIAQVTDSCPRPTLSSYLATLLRIVINIAWTAGLPMPQPFCAFLKSRVAKLAWQAMTPEDFSEVVDYAKTLLENEGEHPAGGGMPGDGWIKSEQERTVVLLNLVGSATCLEALPNNQEAGEGTLDAMEKECMVLKLLQRLMKQVKQRPLAEEAEILRTSPASFVMVLYASLRRVKAVLVSQTQVSQLCRSFHEVARFRKEQAQVQPLLILISVVLDLLNLPGVVFNPPLPSRQETDQTTVSCTELCSNCEQHFLILCKVSVAREDRPCRTNRVLCGASAAISRCGNDNNYYYYLDYHSGRRKWRPASRYAANRQNEF